MPKIFWCDLWPKGVIHTNFGADRWWDAWRRWIFRSKSSEIDASQLWHKGSLLILSYLLLWIVLDNLIYYFTHLTKSFQQVWLSCVWLGHVFVEPLLERDRFTCLPIWNRHRISEDNGQQGRVKGWSQLTEEQDSHYFGPLTLLFYFTSYTHMIPNTIPVYGFIDPIESTWHFSSI